MKLTLTEVSEIQITGCRKRCLYMFVDVAPKKLAVRLLLRTIPSKPALAG